jgi:cob(I)alamin adenosyltransferase
MTLRSEALKQPGEGAGNEGNDAEMKRLKEEITTLSEALASEKEDSVKGKDIRRLEEEFMKLLEALKREKGAAGGNGSEGMSSSTKLRQTVLAERRGCFGGLLWG